MAVTLDTLEVSIKSNSAGASSGIRSLTDSLVNLSDKITPVLGKLKNLSNYIHTIAVDARSCSQIGGLYRALEAIDKASAKTKATVKAKPTNSASEALTEIKAEAEKADAKIKTLTADMVKVTTTPYKPPSGNYYDSNGKFWTREESLAKIKEDQKKRKEELISRKRPSDMYEFKDGVSVADGKSPTSVITGKSSELKNIEQRAENAKRQVKELIGLLEKPMSYKGLSEIVNVATGVTRSHISAEESASVFESLLPPTDEQILEEQKRKIEEKLESVRNAIAKTKEDIKNFGKCFGEATKGISKFIGKVTRVVEMRILRSVIRAISSGVQEGTQNLYQWSKALNGSFANSMDNATTQFLYLKNSVATAVAPLIQQLVPVLQTVVSWVHQACNALAQLFATIRGDNSWTEATVSMKEYSESTKKAGQSAKDLLASWDELNIIQSQSSGGGSNSTTPNYSEMFRERFDFDPKIKKTIQWIKDNFVSLIGIAGSLYGIIKAIQFSSAFTGTLGTISRFLASGLTMALTWQINYEMDEAYTETGESGWLVGGFLTNLLGATLAGKVISKVLGGQAGKLVAGLTLGVSAVMDMSKSIKNANSGGSLGVSAGLGFKSALEGGIASALLALGLGLSTPVVVGAGLITFGVLAVATIATVANVYLRDKDLKWGNLKLSKEQVTAFVEGQMFSADVKTIGSVVTEKIEVTEQEKETIKSKLESAVGTINVIKLGVAKQDDYTSINEQITGEDGIITHVHNLIEANKDLLDIQMKIVPWVENGTDVSKEITNSSKQGWELVDSWFASKGEELGKLLADSEIDEIKKADLVSALIEQITNATSAVAEAEIRGSILGKTNIKLADLTKESMHDVADYFDELRTEATESYTQLIDESIVNQTKLVEALKIVAPGSSELSEAENTLKKMMEGRAEAIQSAVDEVTKPAKEMVDKWIRETFLEIGNDSEYNDASRFYQDLAGEVIPEDRANIFAEKIREIITGAGIDISVLDVIGFSGMDTLFGYLADDVRMNMISAISDTIGAESTMAMLENAGIDVDKLFKNYDFSGVRTPAWNYNGKLYTNGYDGVIGAVLNNVDMNTGWTNDSMTKEDFQECVTTAIRTVFTQKFFGNVDDTATSSKKTANKDFSVTLNPSSVLGWVVNKSKAQYSMATGDEP